MHSIEEIVGFAPLTRQMYSDTTWSGDSYVMESVDSIPSAIEQFANMTPDQRGRNLGNTILKLRQMLLAFNENPGLAADAEWREEYDQVAFTVDSHLAYNSVKQGVDFSTTWQEAARMILIYAQGNQLVAVYQQAKQNNVPPELSVGIDFVEKVIAQIIN